MRILLLGEYSKLHNTLKEGLISLGHEVVLVGDGDGFKNFPVDISIKAKWLDNTPLKFIKVGIYKLFGIDLSKLERAIRCYLKLRKFKGFEVVQLINEKPIKTYPWAERWLLKKVFININRKVLLSCGADYTNVSYYLKHQEERSWLIPMLENPTLQKKYSYVFDFLSRAHRKTHDYIFKNIGAVVATDFDYVPPLKNHIKFVGLIPNPIKIPSEMHIPSTQGPVEILLGINRWNYHTKGITYFEKALDIILQKFPERVKIHTTENLPYEEYIKYMQNAHILLDQVFAKDQGYNALEAMAMGKVVFTGADKDFLTFYNLREDSVCINALPDVPYLVEKLEMLIENKDQIEKISIAARQFVEKNHKSEDIARVYEKLYKRLKFL